LPPASFAARTSALGYFVRLAGGRLHDLLNAIGRHQIGQPVAAEQQRGVGLHRNLTDVDEIGVNDRMRFRADVAIDLIATRVMHRINFGQFAGVLTFADGGVVRRQLLDPAAAKLVQARVSDVADHRAVAVDDCRRQHARHAVPFGAGGGLAMDLIVCAGDRIAQACRHRAVARGEFRAHHIQRRVGRPSARRLTADAIDDDEDAAVGVHKVAILVDDTLDADVGGAGRADCHSRPLTVAQPSAAIVTARTASTTYRSHRSNVMLTGSPVRSR
jgi:hypothetical protein